MGDAGNLDLEEGFTELLSIGLRGWWVRLGWIRLEWKCVVCCL